MIIQIMTIFLTIFHLPSGIIIFYELWMRGLPDSTGTRLPVESRIFHPAGQYSLLEGDTSLDPPDTNYTVTGLQPYTQYEFQVLCENAVGKAASDWVIARTQEDGTTNAF